MDIGLFAFSPVSYANFISCIFLGICPYHQIFKLNVIKLFLISSWDCHTGYKLVSDDPFLNIDVGSFCLNIFPHFFFFGWYIIVRISWILFSLFRGTIFLYIIFFYFTVFCYLYCSPSPFFVLNLSFFISWNV